MSFLPFARNFMGAKGQQIAQTVTQALVQLDPESAIAADLASMEQDLDRAGKLIAELRADLGKEQKEFDGVKKQYDELMSAAEVLNGRVAADAGNAPLKASLDNLLSRIERLQPELDRDRHDIEHTQALLREAEGAYQEKATSLTQAKGNLEHVKHDMQHAKIEEDRAMQRAEQARQVAGLSSGAGSNLTTALNAMQGAADASKQRAAASDMKSEALNTAKDAATDPNVEAALKEVRGTATGNTGSFEDRLKALKR